MTGDDPPGLRDLVPEEQFALIGWGLLAVKEADDGEEFYYAAGRYQGYRAAVEILRNDEVGWPDHPELKDAYAAVGRAIVRADDIETQGDGEHVSAGVQ